MELSQYLIKELAEQVNSPSAKNQRAQDAARFMMFHGKSSEIIESVIQKHFTMQTTVEEIKSRLVPLNLTEKIIKKTSRVYISDPKRRPSNGDEGDQELIDMIEHDCELDTVQKYGNYYWSLFKRNLQEIYLDETGRPRVINIPKHKYEVFNLKSQNIWMPDVVCKIKHDSDDLKNQVLVWWTDESHVITDGYGNILRDRMAMINNTEMVNPYGTMPFVYNNSAFYSVNPYEDDDLIKYAILIPLILSDLLYGLKYQCFAFIYTIGVNADIPFNPNTVISLDRDADGNTPEINTITPSVDAQKVLDTVQHLLGYLLTSKNLRPSVISNDMTAENAASGIAKMIDSSELLEERKDQIPWFKHAEKKLFDKLANNLFPFWMSQGLLADKYARPFSDDFELSVEFPDPKVMYSKKDEIELSKSMIDAKLSSWTRELKKHHPDLEDWQIMDLKEDILRDEAEKLSYMENESDIQE